MRGANPLVVDSVFAALVLVAGLVSLSADPTADHPTPTDVLAIVLVVVGFGALALRRRYPVTVLVVVTVATIVYVVRDYPDNGLPVMALIALYTVASLRPRRCGRRRSPSICVLLLVPSHPSGGAQRWATWPATSPSSASPRSSATASGRDGPTPSQLELRAADLEREPGGRGAAGGGRGAAAHRPGAARRRGPRHERRGRAVRRRRPRHRHRPDEAKRILET